MPQATPGEILEVASRSADSAEVFFVESTSAPVHFEANRVKGADSHETKGAAVRLIKNGRLGFSATSRLANPDALIAAALETAQFGAQAHFDFPGRTDFPNVPVFDPKVSDAALEDMVELGQRIIASVRAEAPDVQIEGSVSRANSEITLMNSKGGSFSYQRSGFAIGFEGTLIRGEDMLFVSDGENSVSPIDDGSGVVRSILRQLAWARTSAAVETRQMPVVFMPTAVPSVVVGPLMSALNGKAVYQGTSPLADKLDQAVVSNRFSLLDDGTLPNVPGSRMSDDEGVPSRRLQLIDEGVVSNFLYDLQTAGLAGAESTGSGERSLGSLPAPGSSVLVVGEGTATLDDMIGSIDEGLVVERLLGAGQGNVLGGDFNANILLGYKIQKGKVVGRVKDTMVTGNVYSILNDIIAIGSQGRWLGGGLYTPAITCANVSVASKA